MSDGSTGSIAHSLQNILLLLAVLTAVKVLLFPAYRSTDFDVHRYWLALVHSLPLSSWYTDETCPNHTLDYPPFFAYFQAILAKVYALVEPADSPLLGLDHCDTSHYDFSLLARMRLSVVLTEFLYFVSLYLLLIRFRPRLSVGKKNGKSSVWLTPFLSFAIMVALPPLLMVDHVHFQYNGFLFGLAVVCFLCYELERYALCGIAFAALLCFKHMFAYLAPAFGVVLLWVCIAKSRWSQIGGMVLGTLAVLVLAFGPFLLDNPAASFKQILSRLFPFQRGLSHAYWAPNAWAIYNTLDKVLTAVSSTPCSAASLTGGLVGLDQGTHCVLPSITPTMTHVLSFGFATALTLLVLLRKRAQKSWILLLCCVHSSLSFFMFSWHVHEKALLTVLIPLGLLAFHPSTSNKYLEDFFLLCFVTTASFFPLLFGLQELPIKWALLLAYTCVWLYVHPPENRLLQMYLLSFVLVEMYAQVFHWWIWSGRLAFFPLILYSLWSVIGVIWVWVSICLKL